MTRLLCAGVRKESPPSGPPNGPRPTPPTPFSSGAACVHSQRLCDPTQRGGQNKETQRSNDLIFPLLQKRSFTSVHLPVPRPGECIFPSSGCPVPPSSWSSTTVSSRAYLGGKFRTFHFRLSRHKQAVDTRLDQSRSMTRVERLRHRKEQPLNVSGRRNLRLITATVLTAYLPYLYLIDLQMCHSRGGGAINVAFQS